MADYVVIVSLVIRDESGRSFSMRRNLRPQILDAMSYVDAIAVQEKLSTYETHERECKVAVRVYDVNGRPCFLNPIDIHRIAADVAQDEKHHSLFKHRSIVKENDDE